MSEPATPPLFAVLTGDELGAPEVPLGVLQRDALAYARTHFQGRTVVNVATGWPIAFGRRGVNKTLNHAARREHVQSVPALPALLVYADWIGKEANRDPDEIRNVPWVHTFAAVLVLAGIAYRVRLIVKETNVGYRFYDHDMIEHKEPADP